MDRSRIGLAERRDEAPAAVARPRAWVMAPRLGAPSEPWIGRQIIRLSGFDMRLVCWHDYTKPGSLLAPVRVLPAGFTRSRWQRRFAIARNVLRGRSNAFGAIGPERRQLDTACAEDRPDVILCHFGHAALRVLPVARAAGVPLVPHFHGLDLSSSLRDRWYRRSLLRSLPSFPAMVVVGSHQREWLVRHGADPRRVHLIPCGVPSGEFDCEREYRCGPVQFVSVSRLVPWKGVDRSIRAFAAARRSLPDARLVVVGEGALRDELEGLARSLDVQDAVHFAGALDAEGVRRCLARSDVFLQHSITDQNGWHEGFGVSITEAMAMRMPVVVTRSGGIPDQVGHEVNGLLVEENDVEAMADAMVRLALDPALRCRLGTRGRERAVSEFDTCVLSARLQRVLFDVIAAHRGAAIRSPGSLGIEIGTGARPGTL
jgi:colanic acid/amylovoran biosynthesis glycosyltransferase